MTENHVFPAPDIYAALASAATAQKMPVTLLMGIAFVESGFQAGATGPLTSAGWRAQGLMQLSPAVIQQFNVVDPDDPKQAALAAAKLLNTLVTRFGWDVDKMLAAYNWGGGNVATAATIGRQWPAQVQAYVRKVKAARAYYQGQSEPVGDNPIERLNNAVNGLAYANPTWSPAAVLKKRWGDWYALNHDAYLVDKTGMNMLWQSYAQAYERAPITDVTTPPPAKIEPDQWAALQAIVKKVFSSGPVAQVVKPAPQLTLPWVAMQPAAASGPGLYVLAGLFLLSFVGRRRSRARV